MSYATRFGSTREVAARIGDTLRARGFDVTLRAVEDGTPVDGYDAVVLGSGVYDGAWTTDATAFIRRQAPMLAQKPVWLFSVGSFGDQHPVIGGLMRKEPKEMGEFEEAVHPRDYRVFAGVIDLRHWPTWARLLFQALGGRDGDNRSWPDIEAWADRIAQALDRKATERIGLTERVNIYAWMLWLPALALSLLPARGPNAASREDLRSPHRATTIGAFVRRHPVPTYFALAFAVSWGGLLAISESSETSGTAWQSDPRLPLLLLVMAMLAGPSVAGLLLTSLVSGRAGLREMWGGLLRWRVGARWYAIALLTAPLVFMAVHLLLSLASPAFLPTFPSIGTGAAFVLGAVVVGFFEELGWTGFAIPRLRLRANALATGLLVGVPWGAWHLVTNNFWIASTFSGELPPVLFMTLNGASLLFGQLAAYRVLMVWVNDRTGSLLVAVLMRLSACTFLFGLSVTGWAFIAYIFALAAAWWIVVAAVGRAQGGLVSLQPINRAA